MMEERRCIIYLQEPEPVAELKRDVIVSGCTLARYPLDDVSLVWRNDEQGSSSLVSTVNQPARKSINQSINRDRAVI